MNKKHRVSNHLVVEKDSLQEIDEYCNLVQAKTGVIKRRIITSLLLEAIHQDIAHVHERPFRPTLTPTAPARDPNIEWMELEIPRCIKTRAQWNCWIGVKKDENLKWEVNGENQQWIIPDEPEGLLDE